MSEHRQHERVASRLRCWCEGENVTLYARIGNLSEGGLFLRTSTPMSLGAKTTVRLGDAATVEASARVVWTRAIEGHEGPAGMGLKFVDLDEQLREQIKALVQEEQATKKGT